MAGVFKKTDPYAIDSGVPTIEDSLRPKPKFVDRISKRVVVVVLLAIGLVMALFMFALDSMDAKEKANPSTSLNEKTKGPVDAVGNIKSALNDLNSGLKDEPGTSTNANPKEATLGSPSLPMKRGVDPTTGNNDDIDRENRSIGGLIALGNGDRGATGPLTTGRTLDGERDSAAARSVAGAGRGTINNTGSEKTERERKLDEIDADIKKELARSQSAVARAGRPGQPGTTVPAIASDTVPVLGQQLPPKERVLTPDEKKALAAIEERESRMAKARGGMSAKAYTTGGSAGGGDPQDAMAKYQASLGGKTGGTQMNSPSSFGGAENTPGAGGAEQDQKLAFLRNTQKEERNYHPHVTISPLSQSEIKAGSFIPMTLEQSINSDLPGQITARVTEDVYDSITGCRLLIPALAKVVGKYDSKIALGQGRILIAWNNLIFPDGGELNLAGMQGYDTGGQSGLASEVDNHYWRLFGLTFGMSMITTGVQLSVPQPNPTSNGSAAPLTPGQILSTSLAQQYGQVGAQILGKYMAIQPTLRNYAGERFIVMVPLTIVFNKVWRSRCSNQS